MGKTRLSCLLGHWVAFLLHNIPFREDAQAFINWILSPKSVLTCIHMQHG